MRDLELGIPLNARHQTSIHYVYVYYLKSPVASSPAELAPLIKYIGLGERDRHTHHLKAAELKVALGEEVSENKMLSLEHICRLLAAQ